MRNINWEAVALLTAFFSIGFLPGWLQFALVLTNALSFIISGFIIINIANLKNYRKQKSHSMDFFKRNGVLGVMGVAAPSPYTTFGYSGRARSRRNSTACSSRTETKG